VEFERWDVPQQPLQAPPIESDQLRHVDHGILIEAAGALGWIDVAWRRAQSAMPVIATAMTVLIRLRLNRSD
jgi:hypothetical protein